MSLSQLPGDCKILSKKARSCFLFFFAKRKVKFQREGDIVGSLQSTKSFNACTRFVNLKENAANPESNLKKMRHSL